MVYILQKLGRGVGACMSLRGMPLPNSLSQGEDLVVPRSNLFPSLRQTCSRQPPSPSLFFSTSSSLPNIIPL